MPYFFPHNAAPLAPWSNTTITGLFLILWRCWKIPLWRHKNVPPRESLCGSLSIDQYGPRRPCTRRKRNYNRFYWAVSGRQPAATHSISVNQLSPVSRSADSVHRDIESTASQRATQRQIVALSPRRPNQQPQQQQDTLDHAITFNISLCNVGPSLFALITFSHY